MTSKRGQATLAALLSLLTLASLSLSLAQDTQPPLPVSPLSALWALGAAGLWMGYRAVLRLPCPLSGLGFWLLSALFAGVATLAHSFAHTGTAELLTGSLPAKAMTLLFFAGRIPLYFMGMRLLKGALEQKTSLPSLLHANGESSRLEWLFQRQSEGFLRLALLIFLCWLPYYVLTFPGTVSNDSVTQLKEIFGVKALSAGNPPVQTFLIWSFYHMGRVFHSADMSVALYCLVQASLLALLFARTSQAILRSGAPNWLFWLTLGFFALCPVFPVFAFCIGKDTNFSMAVLYFSLLLWEFVQTPPQDTLSTRFRVELCIATALLPMLRNPGTYLALLCLLVLLLWCLGAGRRRAGGKQWLAPVWALSALALTWGAIYLVVIPLSGAIPMAETENYSLPLQQVARVVASQPESLTDAQKAAIGNVLPLEELKDAYNGELSDPIKDLWRMDATPEAKAAFFRTWLSMLSKHPATYFSATFHNTYGYLLPGYVSAIKPTLILGKTARTTDIDPFFPFTINPHSEGLKAALNQLTTHPLFRLILAPGLYGWIALFALAILLGTRHKPLLLPAFPALFSLFGCLLSPVNGYFRYAMPLYVCAPLLLTLAALSQIEPMPKSLTLTEEKE